MLPDSISQAFAYATSEMWYLDQVSITDESVNHSSWIEPTSVTPAFKDLGRTSLSMMSSSTGLFQSSTSHIFSLKCPAISY